MTPSRLLLLPAAKALDPALRRMLGRARRLPDLPAYWPALLDGLVRPQPALAVLLAAGLGLPSGRYVLGQWAGTELSTGGAWLTGDAAGLALSAADLDQLALAVSPLLAALGLPVQARTGADLLLAVPDSWPIDAALVPPLAARLGRALALDLPERMPWPKVLTEVQVELKQLPWNQERAARGLPVVGMLVLAGLGSSGPLELHLPCVCSGETSLIGLARLAGKPSQPAEPDAQGLVDLRTAAPSEQRAALIRAAEVRLADGSRLAWRRWHELRWWAAPLTETKP